VRLTLEEAPKEQLIGAVVPWQQERG
jgi:hypothetical protein